MGSLRSHLQGCRMEEGPVKGPFHLEGSKELVSNLRSSDVSLGCIAVCNYLSLLPTSLSDLKVLLSLLHSFSYNVSFCSFSSFRNPVTQRSGVLNPISRPIVFSRALISLHFGFTRCVSPSIDLLECCFCSQRTLPVFTSSLKFSLWKSCARLCF